MPTPPRLTKQQIYRRRRIAAAIALILTLGVVGVIVYVPAASSAPLPAASASVVTPALTPGAPVTAEFPGYGRGAIGAVGFDGVLGSAGEQTAFPIASITKVITALVVLDAKPLSVDETGPEISFTQRDVEIYNEVLAQNGSLQPVRAGLTMSQRQVLETMLIPSANNYAESLAVWAYGSTDAYLAAARTWLDARGLTGTQVVDTNGLSPGDVSTPAELVEIGKLALANPVVAAIVATPTAQEPFVGEIDNTNKLLGTDGIDGIKTGTTDEAGACLLFSSDVTVGDATVTVVGVVLGAETHPILNEGVVALLDSVKPGFQQVTLVTAGDRLASWTSAWGDTATAVASETKTAVVFGDEAVSGMVTAPALSTGTAAGTAVGTATYTVGTATVDVPLVISDPLEDPDFWWRMENPPWSR